MTAKVKRSDPECAACDHPRSRHRAPVYVTDPMCRVRSGWSDRICRCAGYVRPVKAAPSDAKQAPDA